MAAARYEPGGTAPGPEHCAPLAVVDGWFPVDEGRSAGFVPARYSEADVHHSAVYAPLVDYSALDA